MTTRISGNATRKITQGAAQIKLGLANNLLLGNLQARRDWGFAGDYVQAMWQMLQQDEPDDYVVGTGVAHSVEDFVDAAFRSVGLNWQEYVHVDPSFLRPAEVDHLVADPSKARAKLGWRPSMSFSDLVTTMVNRDLYRLKNRLPIYAEAAVAS